MAAGVEQERKKVMKLRESGAEPKTMMSAPRPDDTLYLAWKGERPLKKMDDGW